MSDRERIIPNPSVSILDLLVMTSLQSWSFEIHWIPSGIGDSGILALDLLKQAEIHAWASAKAILTEEQLVTLCEVIDAWISENPDRLKKDRPRQTHFLSSPIPNHDHRKISSTIPFQVPYHHISIQIHL